MPTSFHQTHDNYLTLSACSRPGGNCSMYAWKALHRICVTIAFSSRQVFKPHLKPYTSWTVQRQDLRWRTSIGVCYSFLRKRGNAWNLQKGVEESIKLWPPPTLFCVTTSIMYFSDANFLSVRINKASV